MTAADRTTRKSNTLMSSIQLDANAVPTSSRPTVLRPRLGERLELPVQRDDRVMRERVENISRHDRIGQRASGRGEYGWHFRSVRLSRTKKREHSRDRPRMV